MVSLGRNCCIFVFIEFIILYKYHTLNIKKRGVPRDEKNSFGSLPNAGRIWRTSTDMAIHDEHE